MKSRTEEEKNRKKLRIYLKEIRTKRGLKQGDLAGLLKIPQQTISAYEVGKRMPRIEVLEDIARVLKVDVRELIYGTDREIEPLSEKEGRGKDITASVMHITEREKRLIYLFRKLNEKDQLELIKELAVSGV